jgi:hypothetical protein
MGRYTTADDVASLLSRSLSPAQEAVVDRVIDAAEVWVDQTTGKVYGVNAAATQRFFRNAGPLLRLKNVPLVSIQGVWTRTSFTSAEAALDPTSYEIQDADLGLVYVSTLEGNSESYPIVRVAYTAGNPVPPNIKLGTEYLCLHWLRPLLQDELPGVANFSLGGEESISYSQLVQDFGVPSEVYAMLGVSPGGAFYVA